MSLLEKKIIDKIEILQSGYIQVREAIIIEKEGIEIARTHHRFVLSPGQDLTDQDSRVIAIANAAWTEEVVTKFLEKTDIE
jgi:hypothetical protein